MAMLEKVSLALSLTLFWAGLFASPAPVQEDTAQEDTPQEDATREDTAREDTVREDNLPEPKRYEDVTWNTVYLYAFKAEKEGRAMEILGNHLLPAYEEASVPAPRVVELQTGPWDVMIVSEMEDGPSEMSWQVSPEQPKIQKAMQQMLGKEKAAEITSEYGSAIARSTSFVGMSGRHSAPITDKVLE